MKNKFRAWRTRRIPGQQNKLEAEYQAHLEELQRTGEIVLFRFERHKLKLADKTWYTPDFYVLLPNGEGQMHEVKGGIWEDDARVKIKVAAEQFFDYRFIAVTKRPKKDGGGWNYEMF